MKKGQAHSSEKMFYLWLAVAGILHVAFLGASLFLQTLTLHKQANPRVVSISLVSLPMPDHLQATSTPPFAQVSGSSEAQERRHPESMRKVLKRSLPNKIVVAEKKVQEPNPSIQSVKKKVPVLLVKEPPLKSSLPVRIEAQQPPAPKASEREQLSSALERLKISVANKKGQQQQATSNSTVNKALADLAQKVNSQVAPDIKTGGAEKGGSSAGSGPGKESGSWASVAYKAKIASIIQKNWELANPLLKSSSGMKVSVRIHILSDGSISEIVFVKKSMSAYLNNSVKRALEKSSPLPLLPKEETFRGVWVAFVFTPEGIE